MSMPSWYYNNKAITPCPYTSNLHQVVTAVADVQDKLHNDIVTQKHQGPPIKLDGLSVVVNHLDVANIDLTGCGTASRQRTSGPA